MKFFAAILLVVVVSAVADHKIFHLTDEMKKNYYILMDKCTKATGVDAVLAKKSELEHIETDDKKFKDFMFCVYTEIKYISKSNEIQVDLIRDDLTEYIGKEDAEKFMEKCVVKPAATGPDTAMAMNKCYFVNFPQYYVLEF